MPPVKVAEGNTVPDMFQSRVQLSGDEVALRYKKLGIWHDVSRKGYAQKVREVCMALLALGLKPGECVSVIGENSPEWVYIDLGTMHAGGTTVGVYATNCWEQCQYVVGHSESRFFFVENEEQMDKAIRFRANVPRLERIIVIDEDNVVKYAQDNKIQYPPYATLTQHPEVIKLIQKEVDGVNKTLANVETVKKFTILSKKLFVEDGEVTPTMKVKRKYINEAFKDVIEGMYKD